MEMFIYYFLVATFIMSYDLDLGFKEKPKDLDSILSQLGFRHQIDFTAGKIQCSLYTFYKQGESFCPLEFLYRDRIADPGSWQRIDSSVTVQAIITARGDPGSFDFQKQMEFAKYLRDHYRALLVDRQQTDEKKMVIRD